MVSYTYIRLPCPMEKNMALKDLHKEKKMSSSPKTINTIKWCQVEGGKEISPKTIQEEGCKERPASYCCTLMEYAVEESGYIQYEEREKLYAYVDSKGKIVLPIHYCPFCATDITSLGDLMDDKFFEYVGERKALTREDFDKYWLIIRENLPFEETMRLIAQERAKEEAGAR